MENYSFLNKNDRNSASINPSLMRQNYFEQEPSIKKFNLFEYNKRKETLKSIPSSKFQEKTLTNIDFIKEQYLSSRQSEQSQEEQKPTPLIRKPHQKPKSKGVRFRERISIQNRESIETIQLNILQDISNEEKMSILNNIAKNKSLKLPMTSRRRAPDNVKIVSHLMNSPVQSKSSVIHELRCFMCHYPEQNSPLFGKKTILGVKEKLQQINNMQVQEGTFFSYEGFGYFLKTLCDLNYDSHEVITSFELLMSKNEYPTSIKLMLYYLGSYLYQLNNLYDRSEDILKRMLSELMKFRLYEYVGIYLFLMIKMKANLLDWDSCIKYLMKLLAYSWLYRFDDLEIWTYFELSRSYFFLNETAHSEYFKTRSQMSITEPNSNAYRQIAAKQFKNEIQQMRNQHKTFDLSQIISIYQLTVIKDTPSRGLKDKDAFKLQSQIKSINEHCKIRHVKNLISRMSSRPQYPKTARNFSHQSDSYIPCSSNRHMAGNPLLRTHESGLKNLKVYFRSNPKGQSLLNKNRQPKMYTFQNSNKNILVLKELCRNILIEMKWFVPIGLSEN